MSMGGFNVTSSPPCWRTKTKDRSLASFVRPPEVVTFTIVMGASGSWLKTSYNLLMTRRRKVYCTFHNPN